MTEKEFCEWLAKQHPDNQVEVQQRFIDELNQYGRIVSTEEFLKQVKQGLTDASS